MDTTRTYPRPHPQTAGRVIDGEAVLILADASQINVLNQVGSLIYELSDGQHSVADIAAQLAARFDVSYAQAESDTLEFLHGLETQSVMILETR